MSIQVTIKDGHFITLDELVSIVPLSVAAKELKELRSRIKEPAHSTEQPQAGSEASPKPCLKCIHNQVCMIAAAALRNSGMDVVVNGCNYMEERTASAVR